MEVRIVNMKFLTTIKKNIKFILMFILGLAIFSYPMISQKFYEIKSEREVVEFVKQTQDIDTKEIDRRIDLAAVYNETLDPSRIADPFTTKEKEAKAYYTQMLEVNEMIGHIEIPRINQDLPIYAGTSDNVLEKGAGHLEGTSLPIGGNSTHTVITAHRSLPNALLFRNLDQVQEGDVFYIHNIKETIAYKVISTKVVEPSKFQELLVEEDKDYATLLTCTPYMINSHRLLVKGERIDYQNAIDDGVSITPSSKVDFYRLFLTIIPLVSILVYFYGKEKLVSNKLTKEVEEFEKEQKAE